MSLWDVLPWALFVALVLTLLALDLGVFHRRPRAVRTREGLAWTAFYISLALAFNVLIYFLYERHWLGIGQAVGHPLDGGTAALQFLTGFLLEKSLSLDNIFVIALIFAYFRVPLVYQHRVLFWGVLGALVLRGVMIALGAALISRFDWVVYLFGGILILTAARMLLVGHDELEPENTLAIRIARRVFPVTAAFHGERFFVQIDGRRLATPLFLVLVLVESSDVLFAVDSIPAIFAITKDPFLVFTSNVFAILGLRSLYFAIAPLMDRFRYLKISLVFILAFVGVKMILSHTEPIPTNVSLAVIVGILSVGVLASALAAANEAGSGENGGNGAPGETDLDRLARTTLTAARKIIVLAVASTVILLGSAMVVLPGPGLVVLPIGLAILATEFVWGRRLLRRLREQTRRLSTSQNPSAGS
jgi:tellurite resistance protein TerC